MKSYVEKNLRKDEQVLAKCQITWVAFVPIIIRTILLIIAGWAIAELAVEIFLDFRNKEIPESAQVTYFGSEEWGMISGAAFFFFAFVIFLLCQGKSQYSTERKRIWRGRGRGRERKY